MCLNPECKWITIIEDDKSGEKCYIHYKFAEDGTFEELFTEGDKGLKIYVEVMRDGKYFEPKDYPRPEVPHYDTRGHNGGHESHYYPNYPNKVYNYPNQIAIEAGNRFVMDFAGNILDMEEMNKSLIIGDIIDLDKEELSQPSKIDNFAKEKNPAYKSSNGY
jgi:hypothetical protein